MKATEIETASQLIDAIAQLWATRSVRQVREFIGQLQTEDEFFKLIKLADQADLHTYSHVLATQAHKRFGTLRTFTWQCARLLETGHSLEAEEQLVNRLERIDSDNDSTEELASAHQLLVRVYAQLHRLPEAKQQLAYIQQHKGFIWPDLQGYYFIHSGEWEKAEQLLEQAMKQPDPERAHYVRLLYADVLAITGRPEAALAVLEEGQRLEPQTWTFRADRIRTLFFLGHYDKVLEAIDHYSAQNPYHVHRKSWVHMAAECLYRLERWDLLAQWVETHHRLLEKTVYGKSDIRPHATHKQLRLTPNVQKLNYCVPASLSLMLEAYGMKKGQDEIAAHVFDVTGSDLQMTMAYMESLGFTGRYFKGTIDVYKACIDAGIPVLLSMLIENSAHVQVVVGYDDRLQALIIQDPNDLAPFFLSYHDVMDTYKLTDSLSMVFLLPTQHSILSLLKEQQHRFFASLFAIWSDDEKSKDSPRVLDFLKNHLDERYGAVVGLATQFSEEATALHPVWIDKLTKDLGEEDAEVALMVAHMFYRKNHLAPALYKLSLVTEKKGPYALFLTASILMNQGSYETAVSLLKRSIELDHYQPIAYSHLARCYLELGKTHQAFKWSTIALEQASTEVFVRITHSLIQYELGAYEKAMARFQELAVEHPEDGYFSYETGRCLVALGKETEALEAFEQSKQWDGNEPYVYLRMAEIYMDRTDWPQAHKILEEGIATSETTDVLHMYMGHIAMEQQHFALAETHYRKSLDLEPSDLVITYIGHALLKQKKMDEVRALVMTTAKKGDTDYFSRTAAMLWEESEDANGKALALELIETGMQNPALARQPLVEQYAAFGEEPQFRSRILDRFHALRKEQADAHMLCIEGTLYELEDHQRFAQRLYQQAIDLNDYYMAHFHLGRLAEQLEHWTHARAHYVACLHAEPGFIAAHEGLMRCDVALEDHQRAFKSALYILRHEPVSLELPELFQLVTESNRPAVTAVLEKIASQVPEEWWVAANAHVAENQGDVAKAASLWKQAKAVNGRYQYAQFCMRQENDKLALALLEDLIVEDPAFELFYADYIRVLVGMRKTGDVHKRLKKRLSGEALAIAETYCADQLIEWVETAEGESTTLIGKLRGKSRRFMMIGNIIALYTDATKKFPASEVPVLHLAEFYMARDMHGESVRVLTPFVKRTERFDAKKQLLHATLLQANDEQSEKLLRRAIDQAKVLHASHPDDVDILLWQGDMEAVQDNAEAAEARYEQAIGLHPYRSESYVRLMHLVAESRKETPTCIEQRLPEALQVNEWICLTLASMAITIGDSVTAITRLRALQDDLPHYLPASYEMVRATMASGDTNQAKQLLGQLLETDGGEQFIEAALEDELLADIVEEVLTVSV